MQIDLATPIEDRDGTPFTGPNGREQSLSSVLVLALDTKLPTDQDKDVRQLVKLSEIADRIHEGNGTVELTDTECEELQERVSKLYANTRLISLVVKALKPKD